MFYVKAAIDGTVEVKVELHDDNIFCRCPKCGIEVEVDIAALFHDSDDDLFSTTVFCDKCGKEIREGNYGEVELDKMLRSAELYH